MPTFPRSLTRSDGKTIYPVDVTWPDFPGPAYSTGASGKDQVRDIAVRGRVWVETYGLMTMDDAACRQFLAEVKGWQRAGTVLDVDYPWITTLGIATGTPLVNGASQTGSSIITDGWTPSQTGILLPGDFIKFASKNLLFEVTASADSDVSGNATISINPMILEGSSPAENDPITVSPDFKARIRHVAMPKGTATSGSYFRNMQITFKEAVG